MEVINSVLDSLGFDPIMFGAQVALFYCMHLLLKPILYRPLEKARSERDALTVGRVRQAEQINREALALKAAYEDALLQARQAAQGEVQRARAEAEAASQARLEAARREAEAQLRAAHQEISQERARAEAELDQQVQGLSLAVAGRLVRTLASEGQSQRVVERLREAI